jgi:hypothetical protein
MPLAPSEKCRRCAKLPIAQAKSKSCWAGQICHVRRSTYKYRDRYNQAKRQQYRLATGQDPVVLTIAPPVVASAELHLYRARVDAPLHAIGAELRRGDQVIAKIEPVHTQGLSPAQVKGFLRAVLQAFSEQVGVELGKFEVQQERSPGMCPVQGCSLKQ